MAHAKGPRDILQEKERAIAEVVGFVFTLAIIVMYISVWVVYYVPVQGKAAEIEHMNYVKDWFTDYKLTLDSLWNNNRDDTKGGILVSSSLNLGTLGGSTQTSGYLLPITRPIGSYGVLQVFNYNESLTISTSSPDRNGIFNLSVLEYTAGNYYWIPQTYYYQMGGVFLNQSGRTVARVRPSLKLNTSETPVRLEVTPVDITRASGTVFISGSSATRIDTRIMTKVPTNLTDEYYSVLLTFRLRDRPTARAWRTVIQEEVCKGQCLVDLEDDEPVVTMRIPSKVNLTVIPVNYIVAVQPIGSVVT